MTPDELDIIPRIMAIGTDLEATPDGYCVDFNSSMVGDPYITGTGYLPTIEDAAKVAGTILFVIDVLGLATAQLNPNLTGDTGDPDGEALQSWATIISAARENGNEDGEPLVEEHYDREGDTFTLDINVHGFSLTAEERECLEAVVEEANQRRHRLFTEEGVIVTVERHTIFGERYVDVNCGRPSRRERLGSWSSIGSGQNALDASDEDIIRAVYGDQSIFDTGPAPIVTVEPIGPTWVHGRQDPGYRVKVR